MAWRYIKIEDTPGTPGMSLVYCQAIGSSNVASGKFRDYKCIPNQGDGEESYALYADVTEGPDNGAQLTDPSEQPDLSGNGAMWDALSQSAQRKKDQEAADQAAQAKQKWDAAFEKGGVVGVWDDSGDVDQQANQTATDDTTDDATDDTTDDGAQQAADDDE